jgi:hypothetical protein
MFRRLTYNEWLRYGDVAQLGERGVRNAEVRGSSPLISTMLLTRLIFMIG